MSLLRPVVALSILALGCGGEPDEKTLDVYAASSLRPAFLELADAFQEENPGWSIRFSFAGSQILRMQIEEGAAAAVFASADEAQMRALLSSRAGVESEYFARNALALAVPSQSPIRSIQELPRATRLVIGTEASPIGAYTRTLFEQADELYGEGYQARTLASVVSEESNAGLVRAKVELGAADAAIIYVSDTQSARFQVIPLPGELRVATPYPVAILEDSPPAQAFVRLLHSPAGRTVLAAHGFDSP